MTGGGAEREPDAQRPVSGRADDAGRADPRRGPTNPAWSRTAELRRLLASAGLLSPPAAAPEAGAQPLPSHLLAEVRTRTGLDGSELLHRRRDQMVQIHGSSRLAAPVASTLAAAGVGWIQFGLGGAVVAADACPAGLIPADEGRRFSIAAADAVRRVCPDVRTGPLPPGRQPDLVVLIGSEPVESTLNEALHLQRQPHLVASVGGSSAVIGPLVQPGVTSCLHCADLHRADRDPVWPYLAVQLMNSRPIRDGAETPLTVAAAGLAAAQALDLLDGRPIEVSNATLEWHLPDWRLRRRSWLPHRACGCGAAAFIARVGPPTQAPNTAE
jgi:bacteriocin biosynthesis cyclodehydratase domain-containing protein